MANLQGPSAQAGMERADGLWEGAGRNRFMESGLFEFDLLTGLEPGEAEGGLR